MQAHIVLRVNGRTSAWFCVHGTNEAYDLISALHEKLEGLEAYRKYASDGNTQLWQQLTQEDVRCVGLLCDELERLVKDGKLRTSQPGTTQSKPVGKH